MKRTIRTSAAAVVAAVALAGGLAAPTSAHVTVNPSEASKGGFAKLAFRVPNERPDSGTTKLEVTLPSDAPIANASLKPLAGWTGSVERIKLEKPLEVHGEPVTEAIGKITWTGGTINPGEFQEFEVSVGPLPEDADQLVFKAVQTYASGEVVRWIEEPTDGGEELERPAPVLRLTAATDDHGGAAAEDESAGGEADDDDDDDDSSTVATIALILGALGVLIGIAGFLRGRRA